MCVCGRRQFLRTEFFALFVAPAPEGDGDPFGEEGGEESSYAPMEGEGEEVAAEAPPAEDTADAFPEQPPLDTPVEPPAPIMEIPEENKLTEWLANWKIELEAKNAEHEQEVAVVKEKVRQYCSLDWLSTYF